MYELEDYQLGGGVGSHVGDFLLFVSMTGSAWNISGTKSALCSKCKCIKPQSDI